MKDAHQDEEVCSVKKKILFHVGEKLCFRFVVVDVSKSVILDSEFNGFREGERRKRLFGQYCVLFHLPQNGAGLLYSEGIFGLLLRLNFCSKAQLGQPCRLGGWVNILPG